MDRKIEAILKKVSKPGRYIGGEFGEVQGQKQDELPLGLLLSRHL